MNLGSVGPAIRSVRVAVHDPRQIVAEAMRGLVARMSDFVLADLDAVGASGAEAAPDVVLVGVPSPPDEALEMALALRRRSPELPVVLLADSLDRALLGCVLEHELNGLLLTDCSGADLAACLRQVSKGHAVLPAHWQHVATTAPSDPLEGLSVRQRDVLELLAEGLSYEEIAARLFISTNTVKFHVRGIFVRLGVRNRTSAARFVGQARAAGVRMNPSP